MAPPDGPLLVFGPRSTTYDFGPSHPLTPRRFGPGIDLLRAVGAEPGLAPEPAADQDLLLAHTRRYLEVVRRFSTDPDGPAEAGIGPGDDPPFSGMHDAGAAVAGGSLRAMESILRGDVEHAFHPGGGLHHAMPDRASGFCIYDDPALAIALARREGLRVLYLDFDTHHGDGVQRIHWSDPGVLTFSIHESGRTLFPGTGFVGELGVGEAAGTAINVPLEPYTGADAWLAAIQTLVPPLAATFGPDVIVSQHGADSHAWDPLAHLRVTTTAMGEAATLVDRLAHRYAGGRWLSTGGGGYDVYRVVPRAWALTWLAGAHRPVPDRLPEAWRERWAADAERYDQAPIPKRFEDPPNVGLPASPAQDAADAAASGIVEVVRSLALPAVVRTAIDRGWWVPGDAAASRPSRSAPTGSAPTILDGFDAADLDRLTLAPRVIAPVDPADAQAILTAAARGGATVTLAVDGDSIVGVCLSVESGDGADELVALGVAPAARRRGLAGTLLDRHLETSKKTRPLRARLTLAERDPVEPLDRALRARVATSLLERRGFVVRPSSGPVGRADPDAIEAVRPG